MDDLSLDDLLSGLQAAQQKKTTVRMSERNVVELVIKLKQLGFLGDELLHTTNGREYITRDKLREEVAATVDQAGGRMPLVDLPTALGVDLAHCERAAAEVVTSSKGDIIQAQGELFASKYFDHLAVDVDHSLKETGVVVIGDLARKYGVGVEMLHAALESRMGSAVHGRLEGGVIYTDAYLARVKAQLRGALRGALSPVSLTSLRRDLGLENLGALSALVPSLVEELRRGGAISGKSVAGSWVPASHSHAQQDAVRAFFQQNGYVTHAMAAKHGMPNAAQGLKGAFPDGLALGSAFVGAAVLHQVEAAVEEAVQSGTWCDVQDSVPSALDPEDAAQLLAQCKAAKGPGVKVLAETCAVSAALLDAMRAALKSEAADAARAAHASRKTAAGGEGTSGAAAAEGSGSKKKGGKGGPAAPAVEGDDSEDDWDTGKGKGKKGGKGGKKGKPAGKAADPPKPPAKGAAKGGQNDTSAATTAALSPDALHRRLVELYPDVDGAGVDGELPGAIVGEVRPAVVAEYERALAAIFTEGAEQRRRLRDAATARLTSSYEALQLHAHGAQLFSGDEGTLGVLQKHLMRTAAPACMDALLHFLAADAAEESENGDTTAVSPEEAVGVAFTPAQRAAAAKEAPAEAKAEVTSALDALSGASTTPEEFSDALQHAAGAVGLRLKHLDKKTEASKVAEQVALLQEQAMNAADAPTLLAVVVPLLVAKHRGRCVSLPGRALAPAVEMLKESLSEEEHEMLGRFHAAVVEQLRGEDRGAVLEELTAEVRKLVAG